MAVDWSELPPELLYTIANKLEIHIDFIRFRAVCLNWRSSTPNTPIHLPCQFPWLMLPQTRTHRRSFFSFPDNKFHFLNLPEASAPHRRRRCGSSLGWLTILEESPEVLLFNPITRAKIPLPPLSTFANVSDFNIHNVGREYSLRSADGGGTYTCSLKEMRNSFIKKVILSNSPSEDRGFVAMAILNETGDLAFCKRGDESWRFVEEARSYSEDVVYHDQLFYAVNKYGAIAVCDLRGESPSVRIVETPRMIGGDMQYLVGSKDGILLVTRYLDFGYDDHQLGIVYHTTLFQVYKLDTSDNPNWEKVSNLGDQMLFLGENSSFSLLASDFGGECKGNCIYFTDDYSEMNYDGSPGSHDLGVYNFESGRIDEFSCSQHISQSTLGWPSPIWVTPNPC